MKKITPWLPALLWMALIFAMSAAPGEVSGEQSGRLLELLIAVYGFFFGDTHLPPQALYTLETLLRKADSCFMEYPAVSVSGRNLFKAKNGNLFSAAVEDGIYRVYDENGAFLLLGRAEQGKVTTIKSFFEV